MGSTIQFLWGSYVTVALVSGILIINILNYFFTDDTRVAALHQPHSFPHTPRRHEGHGTGRVYDTQGHTGTVPGSSVCG